MTKMTKAELMGKGFFKVAEDGGTYVVATFFNPQTEEQFSECVRDYEYEDCSRDNDELYYMEIDDAAKRAWRHWKGEIQVGDKVEVVKGRKIPIGTKGIVVKERDIYNRYGQWVAHYVVLDTGVSTNVKNCAFAA